MFGNSLSRLSAPYSSKKAVFVCGKDIKGLAIESSRECETFNMNDPAMTENKFKFPFEFSCALQEAPVIVMSVHGTKKERADKTKYDETELFLDDERRTTLRKLIENALSKKETDMSIAGQDQIFDKEERISLPLSENQTASRLNSEAWEKMYLLIACSGGSSHLPPVPNTGVLIASGRQYTTFGNSNAVKEVIKSKKITRLSLIYLLKSGGTLWFKGYGPDGKRLKPIHAKRYKGTDPQEAREYLKKQIEAFGTLLGLKGTLDEDLATKPAYKTAWEEAQEAYLTNAQACTIWRTNEGSDNFSTPKRETVFRQTVGALSPQSFEIPNTGGMNVFGVLKSYIHGNKPFLTKTFLESLSPEAFEACVNPKDPGKTPLLHTAVENGATEIVKTFLAYSRTDVNIIDQNGETPLGKAVRNGNTQMVKALIGDQRTNINYVNELRQGALIIAVEKKDTATVKALIADPRTNVNAINTKGETPLHIACLHNNGDIIKELLMCDSINIEARDRNGRKALGTYKIFSEYDGEDPEIIKAFEEAEKRNRAAALPHI